MTEITYEQAKEHLCSYGTAVHCEVFRQYREWHYQAARDCSLCKEERIEKKE